jgi:hypothetical protein
MGRRRSLAAMIGRHFAPWRKSRRTTLTALVFGLLMGRRLGLAAIARRMAGPVSVRHKIKWVGRFADNGGVRVHEGTPCLIQWLLSLSTAPPVVAWTVMGQSAFSKRRKSRNQVEEKLIVRLKEAFGQYPWLLVADRGFARADLFAKLRRWDIRYVIRACGNPWVDTGRWSGQLWNMHRWPGCCTRYGRVLYHKSRPVPVSLVVVHKGSAPEPWYLVTNAPGSQAIEKAYRRRCWIEEHFRDAKSGLGLSSLRLHRAQRVERLLLVAAVAVLVAIAVGLGWRSEHGEADPQLTSHKRGRSLSVLRLGCELIYALMVGPLPVSLLDRPLPLAPESTL